ncbi:protein translocase subunit SecD [Magnetospira sp. QH-2]|uniref:protein translocase subunit SecD n=1 Tax=Magnetospira sp. (strain QH-2) TaxID=1288970 RepID=UPI0003E816F9|nr:protein translocase subunit SecD [Magnetospira sp. QH-2]CCQ73036.1 Protein-export membrane protein secD [Magnetospira sp. QH-2]
MVYMAKWKVILIIVVGLLGLSFALPNLVDRQTAEGLPSFIPSQQVNLGLDLQGGSHMLLEVDLKTVIRERMDSIVDSARAELRKAKIRYDDLNNGGDKVTLRIKDLERMEQAHDLIYAADRETLVTDGDNGLITVVLTEQAAKARITSAVEQSIEIVRRRIDETGTREPTIQRQGEDRILVQLPGVKDPERIKALLGQTAKMTFHLVDIKTDLNEALSGRVPPRSMLVPSADEIDPASGQPRMYVVHKRVQLSGENLEGSQPTFDQQNRPVVSFSFDGIGGRKFAKITTENTGKPFAIVLDGKVISAPRINEPILGGSGIITGGFSVQEASDLALLLRAGALPAPLTILEERTVGPGLGADSIAAGKIASIIGLVLVIVFMGAAYGLFGLMANVALLVNLVLIVGALSALQATLTLPGIAGIVLTIGMAVDANVLIFERIREEGRIGRTPIAAIDAGYQRALTTIIDANVTTLIAAMLLFSFGSGPVKGFAVTLAIGIVTSMFTAIMVTRLMVVTWLRSKRPSALPI